MTGPLLKYKEHNSSAVATSAVTRFGGKEGMSIEILSFSALCSALLWSEH